MFEGLTPDQLSFARAIAQAAGFVLVPGDDGTSDKLEVGGTGLDTPNSVLST